MTYFDPNIYHYKYLEREDKEFIRGMWAMFDVVVRNHLKCDIMDELRKRGCFTGMTVDEFFDDLEQNASEAAHNYIVSALDNYVGDDMGEEENRCNAIDKAQDELGEIRDNDILFAYDGDEICSIEDAGTDIKGNTVKPYIVRIDKE